MNEYTIFKPIRTRRTCEEAVEQIANAIATNEYRLGDRLPPERVLALQMAVSRPTIREALKILADAGVIEVVGGGRGGGAFVRSEFIPPTLLADGASLRVSEVAGVLVTRRILEPRVAQLAAVQATDADLERMERTIELQEGATGRRARFIALDSRFHVQVAQATGNMTVEAVMRAFMRRLERAQDLALRGGTERTWTVAVADHRRIVAALRARDPEAAQAAILDHLDILERAWGEETGQPFHQSLPAFLLSDGERTLRSGNGDRRLDASTWAS